MQWNLTREEKKTLLRVARESVSSALGAREYQLPTPKGGLLSQAGVFVTIHASDGRLRGCIGQLYGRTNLIETVEEVARSSAFQDPRFPPVKKEELPDLVFEISLLSPFQKARPEDVMPGKHGIYLKRGFSSGLLLPQVATEQGWDRIQFLEHGCRKAGMEPLCWQDPRVEVYVFTALVFKENDPDLSDPG